MHGRPGLTRRLKAAAALLLPFSVLLLTACAPGDPQDSLTRDGDVSARITDLFWPVFIIACVVFVLVEGFLVYTLIRYRRRPNQTELPKQVHGSTPLEIGWTIAPVLILAAIAIPTLRDIRWLSDTPDNALEIQVTAQQWWWNFTYVSEGNLQVPDELVIPVGQPVHVMLHSNDVIHSFWVPKLAGKTDVVPNHNNEMWFNAKQPGIYSGQCAEFCALSHAKMKFEVRALSPDDYTAWLAAQKQPAVAPPSGSVASQGMQVFFQQPCWTCHTISGSTITVGGKTAVGTFGPNLTHFATRNKFAGAWLDNNTQDLQEWLRDPPAVKPGSKMPDYNLSEDEINQLIAFLQTLK